MFRRFYPALLIMTVLMMAAGCKRGKPSGSWDSAGYHVRGSEVYYLAGWTSQAFKIDNADAASFKYPLPGGETVYALDKNRVYYRGEVIPDADPATFQFIHGRFWKDKDSVFSSNYRVCDDPEHFVIFTEYMFKNSHTVYRLGNGNMEVLSRDPANFKEIGISDNFYFYTADTEKVFMNGMLLKGADPATFKILKGAYTRDDHQAFYFDSAMPKGTLIDSLQALDGGFAKDARRVYYLGKVLPGADAATFVITDPKWPKARDKNFIYDQGTPKPLDSQR